MADKKSAALHGSGPCCARCRTPYGVCATQWTCDHHRAHAVKEARRELELQHIRDMQRAAELAERANRRQW